MSEKKEQEKHSRVGLFVGLDSNQDDQVDNPLDDLTDFAPKTKSDSGSRGIGIERIAKENDFPSRKATHEEILPAVQIKQRRYRTGRNRQFNIKVTERTANEFYRIADIANVPHGQLLEMALNALVKSEERFKEDANNSMQTTSK